MDHEFDLIVIGGGIGGVICLHYAREAGFNAVLLERADCIGGLWAKLPAWQEIQQTKFDWTLGDLPIDGEDQRAIQENIQLWVSKFDLAPHITLNSPVISARQRDDGWEVITSDRTYACKYLVAATGVQNEPIIPNPIRKSTSGIQEFHSSTLSDPTLLNEKRVLVVGGGASAFDLLELCVEQQAKAIHWVYRSLRWMAPTKKPKRVAGATRWLGTAQMSGQTVEQLNQAVNDDLRARYRHFNLNDILPDESFDFVKHQLIPGRHQMIEHFDQITRHRAEVLELGDRTAVLTSGEQISVDTVLWGTGYRMDLSFFEANELSSITQADVLASRCGSGIVSLDYPNLFFMVPKIVGGIGSLPWAYAHTAIAIMRQMRGQVRLGAKPISGNLNYYEFIKFLANMDPDYYVTPDWPQSYADIASALDENLSDTLPIPPLR